MPAEYVGKDVAVVALDNMLAAYYEGKQIQMSGFPIKKTLDDFDFSFQPSIDKRQINELATMCFLENVENVNGAPARAQRSGSRGERRKE